MDENSVGRGVDEPTVTLFAFPERRLGDFALGDIRHQTHESDKVAVQVAFIVPVHFDIDVAPVPGL